MPTAPCSSTIQQRGDSEVLFAFAASPSRELVNQNRTRIVDFQCPSEVRSVLAAEIANLGFATPVSFRGMSCASLVRGVFNSASCLLQHCHVRCCGRKQATPIRSKRNRRAPEMPFVFAVPKFPMSIASPPAWSRKGISCRRAVACSSGLRKLTPGATMVTRSASGPRRRTGTSSRIV